jgi:hypothetical protein
LIFAKDSKEREKLTKKKLAGEEMCTRGGERERINIRKIQKSGIFVIF